MQSRTHNDAAYVRQEAEDLKKVYNYRMAEYQNFRPALAGPQGAGVFVDRPGNAASQVDLESVLRNQSFVNAKCAERATTLPPCTHTSNCDLVPQVQHLSRASDPLAGKTIDRFEPVPRHGMGFQYGYAQVPLDTRAAAKDELARCRQ